MSCHLVAARWWADKLRRIKPEDYEIDNSDKLSLICTVTTANLAKSYEPNEYELAVFEETLAKILKERVEKGFCTRLVAGPPMDNNPLIEAANKAGISKYILPFNSEMVVTQYGKVIVKDYGKPKFQLYPEEE